MAFEAIFQPINIGSVEIKNRLVAGPMNTLFAQSTAGYVNEQVLAYYAARAKGGCGLVITEAALGTRQAARFPAWSNLLCYEQSHIPGLNELVETCHDFGSRVFIQLSPGFGRQGNSPVGEPSPAPSDGVPYEITADNMPRAFRALFTKIMPSIPGPATRGMTVEEIQSEHDEFATSAELAVRAEFDGIEIHCPHGYLGQQFLSPRSNKRTDQYGGSLENRMRFIVELVQKTIAAVPPGFPVGIRLSADEHMPDGVTLDEMKVVARKLEDLDIAYIHMSSGSYEAISWLFPGDDAIMVDEAKAFKDSVSIPIIATSIHDPKTVDKVISEGKADMVSLARAHFADPEWPNKVKAGGADDIERCRRDFYCVCRFLLGLPVRCHRNTNLGREKYMPEYWRSAGAKGIEVLPRYLR
ncbi:MAG: NADH:flavin oxidoreductase [Dehalococcoidia bacterium]|jgi:2,4-dienoyl-CoA reductase-like NADH-dependent reductase (Old Yellow Enzyme family)|nr:NADH:flavin oxidoreductase [Dehalococcoidia bacterium]